MAGWHVTGQLERTQMGPSGQFTPAVEVHFVLDNGTAGSVVVPRSAYNADAVKERIDAYAAHLDAVASLRA